jgi:glycine reductase complex component B subunit gamma
LERKGIPTAHITAITPVALMVGSNRIIPGSKIVNPLGNADFEEEDEEALRKTLVEKALKALQTDIKEQTLFQ